MTRPPSHRSVARGLPVGAVALAAASMALIAPIARAADEGLRASVETDHGVYYQGDPIRVRLSLRTRGAAEIPNPVEGPLEAGLRVRIAAGEELVPDGSPADSTQERPDRISSKAWETTLDATSVFGRLRQPGSYELWWSGGAVAAPPRRIRVIGRYDPTRAHSARVVTSEGTFEFDLLAEQAPVAAKMFVDVARAGYYDGLGFDELRPGEYVMAGRHSIDDLEREPFRFPAELSATPLVPGIVIMRPIGASPPMNGQEFAVLLGPQHLWAGQVTVLGRVTQGLDLVQRISTFPSSGEMSAPFFKPLKEIKIRHIEILDRGPADAGRAPAR